MGVWCLLHDTKSGEGSLRSVRDAIGKRRILCAIGRSLGRRIRFDERGWIPNIEPDVLGSHLLQPSKDGASSSYASVTGGAISSCDRTSGTQCDCKVVLFAMSRYPVRVQQLMLVVACGLPATRCLHPGVCSCTPWSSLHASTPQVARNVQ